MCCRFHVITCTVYSVQCMKKIPKTLTSNFSMCFISWIAKNNENLLLHSFLYVQIWVVVNSITSQIRENPIFYVYPQFYVWLYNAKVIFLEMKVTLSVWPLCASVRVCVWLWCVSVYCVRHIRLVGKLMRKSNRLNLVGGLNPSLWESKSVITLEAFWIFTCVWLFAPLKYRLQQSVDWNFSVIFDGKDTQQSFFWRTKQKKSDDFVRLLISTCNSE